MPELTVNGAPTLLGDIARRLPGLTRRMSAAHAAVALRTESRVFGSWFGARILVLETRGRRSGRLRATPLVYLPDGDALVVVPANAGADRPPAWWLNLQAAGEGFVVLDGRRRRIAPAIAAPGEHERLWQRMAAVAPIDHYQRRSRRPLPVVVLRRAGASAPARRSRDHAVGLGERLLGVGVRRVGEALVAP